MNVWAGFFAVFLGFAPVAGWAQTQVFTVDSTMDLPDLLPGDGACLGADGHCTLRAALMEVAALDGPPEFEVRIPPGIYALSQIAGDAVGNLPATGDLDASLAAGASVLTIRGWDGDDAIPPEQRPMISVAPDFKRRLLNIAIGGGQTVRLVDIVLSGARSEPAGPFAQADPGAALRCHSDSGALLALNRVAVKGNWTQGQGAVFLEGCSLDATSVSVEDNCSQRAALLAGPTPPSGGHRNILVTRSSLTGNSSSCILNPDPIYGTVVISATELSETFDVRFENVTIAQNVGAIIVEGHTSGVGSRQVMLRHVTAWQNLPGFNQHDGLLALGVMTISASHSLLGESSSVHQGVEFTSLGRNVGLVMAGPNAVVTPHASDLTLLPEQIGLDELTAIDDLTWGFEPAPDSALVDNGASETSADDPTRCAPTDQRGQVRPVGTACDIGAIERVAGAAQDSIFADGFETPSN